MAANVFVITCTHKVTGEFEELAGAYVYRGLAEAAKNNLKLNFPDYDFEIRVLELQGVVSNLMSLTPQYCFDKEENK